MTPATSSLGGGLDAWELTRRISPRPIVRVAAVDAEGRAVNSYPTLRPVIDPRPPTPWAVPLADSEGRFHLLCADLDPKGSPQAATADAGRLSALLKEVGLPHVVCESGPTGGRHVWLALGEPVDAVLVRALAHLLKAWLPTLDLSPLVNPASGCVRPPGTPHRAGGTSRVIAGSTSTLTHPTATPDQVRDLTARLATRAPTPPRLGEPRRRPVAVADGMPFLPGPRRPLSAACRTALESTPSGDLSRVLWRVLCGAAAARWRFENLAAIADSPGLEHARSVRTGAMRSPRPPAGPGSPAAILRRQWTKAVHAVARLASDPPQAVRDESFDVRAETVAELVRAVQRRADASAGRWGTSRAALAQRRVLDALCLYHLQSIRPDDVEADIRRLALTCGLDRETARRALIALAADGWIARTRPSIGPNGAHWTIDPSGTVHTRISLMLSQAVPRPASTGAALRAALDDELTHRLAAGAHDAFAPRGGLGLAAGGLYGRLQLPTTTLEASRLMGWTIVKTTHVLERLAAHGLLTYEVRAWQAHDDHREQVAQQLGTAGRGQQRAALYSAERASWAWWQAEVAWMRARRPSPWTPLRRAGRPATEGGPGWPAHPRRRDGRADFKAARRLLRRGNNHHVAGARPRSRGRSSRGDASTAPGASTPRTPFHALM